MGIHSLLLPTYCGFTVVFSCHFWCNVSTHEHSTLNSQHLSDYMRYEIKALLTDIETLVKENKAIGIA